MEFTLPRLLPSSHKSTRQWSERSSVNLTQVDDGRHIANLILLNRNTAMAIASDSRLSSWRKMPIGPKALQYRDARPALPSRALGFGGVALSFLIGEMDILHAPDKREESYRRRRRRTLGLRGDAAIRMINARAELTRRSSRAGKGLVVSARQGRQSTGSD